MIIIYQLSHNMTPIIITIIVYASSHLSYSWTSQSSSLPSSSSSSSSPNISLVSQLEFYLSIIVLLIITVATFILDVIVVSTDGCDIILYLVLSAFLSPRIILLIAPPVVHVFFFPYIIVNRYHNPMTNMTATGNMNTNTQEER